MASLKTTDLDLANHQGETWVKNIRGGVLSKLAPEAPDIKVGKTDHFTFTTTPKAELVGESQNKSSNDDNATHAQHVFTQFPFQVQYNRDKHH